VAGTVCNVFNMTATPLSSPGATPCVLVVDSDADNRGLYRDAFTLSGWNVTQAADGREALVQALLAKPWVIVTELRLPIIDGVALCEILRRDKATAAVPILVVTSETHSGQLARAQRAGADGILIKPSTPDIVIAEMRRLTRAATAANAAAPPPALPTPGARRTVLVKAHHRHATTTPDEPAITLACPICGEGLRYQETFIGGVSSRHPERWDYYQCAQCGQFQYRYRTRKLRHLS
jgi:DNA-binding response OmpR family regulator